jgi:hypothetical protein
VARNVVVRRPGDECVVVIDYDMSSPLEMPAMSTIRFAHLALLALLLLTGVGCKTIYYGTMETFGYEKRDLLVERVEEARDAQTDASEQFKTTFERFSEVANFQGGELEAKYKSLNSELDRAKSRATTVTDRIASVEKVAEDLFAEWKKEQEQFSSTTLRANSEKQLRDTKNRYEKLLDSMKAAESRMSPVLVKFGDYVLALKHSLNAQAIGSLEGVATELDSEVASLIADMQKSIDEADAFLESMKTTSE